MSLMNASVQQQPLRGLPPPLEHRGWAGVTLAGAQPVPPSFRGDRHFKDMLERYRHCGGLARHQEVVGRALRQQGPNAASFARWIAEREVISFLWQGHTWLPLAQFYPFDMRPLLQLRQILGTLNPVLDSLQLANWFATRNRLLNQRTPADALALRPSAVLAAAQVAAAEYAPADDSGY